MFGKIYGINRPRAKRLARAVAGQVADRYKRPLADIIRTIHLNLLWIGALIFITNELCVRLIITFAMLVLAAFYINGGCVVTDLEMALYPDGAMIVDPVLELCDIPVTNATRSGATLAFINGALAVALIVYLIRFPS